MNSLLRVVPHKGFEPLTSALRIVFRSLNRNLHLYGQRCSVLDKPLIRLCFLCPMHSSLHHRVALPFTPQPYCNPTDLDVPY